MSLLRAFIALEIPANFQQEISNQTTLLRKAIGLSLVRWVHPGNMHFTLKFLGNIPPADVDGLAHMLTELAGKHTIHEIQIGGLGAFPNPRRPRVIWIGMQAPAALNALHTGLEAATAKLGFPPENRPFHPHLTLGRVKQGLSPAGLQTLQDTLENTKIGQIGTIQIEALHLFKSDLKPSGAVYTKLHSAPLNKPKRGDI